ncbi:MAG TPA: hypothetical protein H9875_06075 [Candidatus Levilactobacillus faecigallinarum]|uniref:Uncharacterized protein n=1 Tax=Candidatus Levilactobacillus faecigallinarum TaxID=2838638 RepID=A0A9D1U4R3_9LACO|nr:hypothetical protein [Candidatus Levilactobacillus faecigallinarum]
MDQLVTVLLQRIDTLVPPHALNYDLEGLDTDQENDLLTRLKQAAPDVKFRILGRRDRVLVIRKK